MHAWTNIEWIVILITPRVLHVANYMLYLLFQAQEIIDAFFIKFDEQAVLNRYNIPYGHTSYGSTAVTGRGGPFPTGDSLNQWIQQVKL